MKGPNQPVLGGKISGAGGGGFMFFFAEADKRYAVAEALRKKVPRWPIIHSEIGLHTWGVRHP